MTKSLLISFLILSIISCSSLRPPRSRPVPIYTVKHGDTLSQIGQRYGVDVDELRELNDDLDPKKIRAGMKLEMPDWLIGSGSSKVPRGTVYRSVSSDSGILRNVRHYVGELSWPIKTSKGISSIFGKRWHSYHEGLDLRGKIGTPIYATHGGKVTYSGNGMSGFGNVVIVQAKDGLMTVYAHNRRNYASKGDRVQQGQKIAELGLTGRTTGPHVHYETRIRNSKGKYVAVNPLLFYPKEG